MSKTITKGFLTGAKVNGISIKSTYKCSSGNYNNCSSRSVSYVVMHYTGNSKDTPAANAKYFQTSGRGASAHFFVGNKNIYQSVELRDIAWHCGATTYKHASCRNANSIGIEMCCTAGNYKISDKTITNAAYLCAYICEMLGIKASQVDTYVVRHYDVTGKQCPAQMVTNSSEWKAFKTKVKNILNTGSDTSSASTSSTTATTVNYKVKIIKESLVIRATASASAKSNGTVKKDEVYTIVKEKKSGSKTFGKLKSGAGWINLAYTKKV